MYLFYIIIRRLKVLNCLHFQCGLTLTSNIYSKRTTGSELTFFFLQNYYLVIWCLERERVFKLLMVYTWKRYFKKLYRRVFKLSLRWITIHISETTPSTLPSIRKKKEKFVTYYWFLHCMYSLYFFQTVCGKKQTRRLEVWFVLRFNYKQKSKKNGLRWQFNNRQGRNDRDDCECRLQHDRHLYAILERNGGL